MKELDWLKRNKEYLNLSGIARKAGINVKVLHNTIENRVDGHGTPFKIPAKYHEQLKSIISQIRKQ